MTAPAEETKREHRCPSPKGCSVDGEWLYGWHALRLSCNEERVKSSCCEYRDRPAPPPDAEQWCAQMTLCASPRAFHYECNGTISHAFVPPAAAEGASETKKHDELCVFDADHPGECQRSGWASEWTPTASEKPQGERCKGEVARAIYDTLIAPSEKPQAACLACLDWGGEHVCEKPQAARTWTLHGLPNEPMSVCVRY